MLQICPDNPELLVLHAISLHQQRKLDDALAVYARLTRLFPQEALHWSNYATILQEMGNLPEAALASATALALDPVNADLLIGRGLLHLQSREFIEARDTLLKAVDVAPDSPAARIHAARACAICRDYRADGLTDHWQHWLPLSEDLQVELAELKLMMGDANASLVLLEDLRDRSALTVGAQLLLAAVYERVNRVDDSRQLLHKIMQTQPDLVAAHRCDMEHLAAALLVREGAYEKARMLLEKAGARHEYDYAHYFSLAEVHDKLGAVEPALAALFKAHAVQVSELRQTVPARFESDAPILPAAVARVSAADYLTWPPRVAPAAADSPVFIVGFPRSGTTLLEQMLDAHPALQSMDERPFFNLLADQLADHGINVPADLGKLDQLACDELRKGYLIMACSKIERRWGSRLVDKNPLNMLWLPMIHRLFPNASFILALRHPADVLVSNYMQNYRASVLAAAAESMEGLARAYVTAMECWLHHVEVFKPHVMVSRYEQLVADPAAQTRRIGDFLGLDDASPLLRFDHHARAKGFIATPSYTQVIQPVNRKGLDRWVRYRDALAPALPILAPMMKHWGYSLDTEG
jgi:tetratricopeptide (TPR) repeat protein